MSRPDPVWEIDYKADRRNHHHRCFCCNRILQTGERVVMTWRRKGTVAAHAECANRRHIPESNQTTREVMRHWGLEALKARGWHVPELETHY